MEETAYAKINLALHVRGREPDGYHRIETLFAFAEDGDRLRVEPGDALTLHISGPFGGALGDAEDNLVVRAATALRSRFGVTEGTALFLDKRLPVASGIGGGSADAAAALRLLVRWWDLPASRDDLMEIAASLGADVPACIESEVVRGTGRGDVLSSQDDSGVEGTPLLLINPGVPLSTGEVFAAWDGLDRGPLPMLSPLATAIEGRNDLEAPARGIAPEIGEILEMLEGQAGLIAARMSGSGATCFGLFESEAARDEAAAAASPRWWQLSSRLR